MVNSFTLADFPLFNGLPKADLQEFLDAAQERSLKPTQRLLSIGETPANLYFVLEGRLQSHETADDGRTTGLETFGPGEAIGLLSMIDGLPTTVSMSAIEPTVLTFIPMSFAQKLFFASPLLTQRLLKIFAANVRKASNHKSMLSLPNAFHRIFVHINKISEDTPTGHPLTQLPRQHQLASIVNTSRETVSRALQALIKSGVMSKVGRQVVIIDADTLRKLAADGPDALLTKR